MRSDSTRLVQLAALLALAGCTLPNDAPVGVRRDALETHTYPRYLDYDDAWIQGRCPRYPLEMLPPGSGSAGIWIGERLFDQAQLDPERPPRDDMEPVGRLRGYCQFRWQPSTQNPDAYRPYGDVKPPNAPHHEQEDTDLVSGLEPMARWDVDAKLNRPAIVKALRNTARSLWDVSRAAYALVPPRPRVRVALIDNGPYGSQGELAPDDAPHVRSVANVVRELACPDGEGGALPCPVALSSHLALPQIAPDQTNYAEGGYFGRRSQVAVALWDAAFQAGQGSIEQHRVVLNLSIGWQAEASLGAADLAVRDAIAFARCRGHLVIAAAGNRADVFDETLGPLHPGAWESEPALSRAQCEQTFHMGSSAPPEDDDAYSPLVFAVGATDAYDLPLVSARPLARPPLAAHGHGVLTGDTLPLPPELAPASGSSYATAAVSAIAALVWAVAPELPAGRVMELVYRSGVGLFDPVSGAGQSDFSLPPGPHAPRGEVRRVSMCRAVLLAASQDPARCRATPGAYAGSARAIRNLWQVVPRDVGTASQLGPSEVQAWIDAHADTVVITPWAGPQPTSPGCSTCRVLNKNPSPAAMSPAGVSPAELEVSLTPEMLASAEDVEVVLTLETSAGTEVHEITLPPGVRNFTVPLSPAAKAERASLTFRHSQAGAVFDTYQQILVE